MGTRISIGELAARTGLPVRTLRYYSDRGLLPPAARSEAGYRLYDEDAVARVALVRTLRELGVGLKNIARVLDRELDLAGVAAAHAAALDAQIRVLRLSRTVARLAARRELTPEEMTHMHDLARLSEAERRRIVDDFLDDVLGDHDVDPALAERMRAARPDLPEDPSPEQVEAWIELAELVADPDFRSRIRAMSERGAADRSTAEAQFAHAASQLVVERAGRGARRRCRSTLRRGATGRRRDRRGVRVRARTLGRPGISRVAGRHARDVHGRARRALLAAAGRHQRLAGAAGDGAGVGVAASGARLSRWHAEAGPALDSDALSAARARSVSSTASL